MHPAFIALLVLGIIVALTLGVIYFATDRHLIRLPWRDRAGVLTPSFFDAVDYAATLPWWKRSVFIRRWGNDKIHPRDVVRFHVWWEARRQLSGGK